MNQIIKNILGIAIILTILMFSYAAIEYVRTYSKTIEPSSFRSFNVSAQGKVVAIPDVAQFTFSVITQGGKNIGTLQKDNTTKINKAIDFIKSLGVDKKDIKTSGYYLTPRYQYFDCRVGGVCPPAEIVGYEINQTVTIKLRNFDKIGDALSGVIQNGANSVSEISFTIDDPTELQNQARAEAIAKAKNQALAIAKAGNFGLGKILSINEITNGSIVSMYESVAKGIGGGGADSAPSPNIEPGSQEVTINMTIKYEIQ